MPLSNEEALAKANEYSAKHRARVRRRKSADILRSALVYLDQNPCAPEDIPKKLEIFAHKIQIGTLDIENFKPDSYMGRASELGALPQNLKYVHGATEGPWAEAGAHPYSDNGEGLCFYCEGPKTDRVHPHGFYESRIKGRCRCGRPKSSIVHDDKVRY